MKKDKINRILIIGKGEIAKRHYKILKELIPNAKIKFLIRKRKNKIFSSKYLYSLDEVKKFMPELGVIANPSSKHIKISEKLIDLDIKYLFIEKPISNYFDNAKKFVSKCNKKNINLFVGYNLKFTNSLIKIKKLIDNKILKNIFLVTIETGFNLKNWRKKKNYIDSVSSQKKLGGGVLLELSHEIDYLHWLFGKFEKIDAYFSKLSLLKLDVEDFVNLRVFFNKKFSKKKLFATLNIDFFRNDKVRKMTIISEKETLKWDGIKGEVKIYNEETKKWKYLYKNYNDLNESYIRQWKYFLECIKKNFKNSSSKESLDTIRYINSIKKQ